MSSLPDYARTSLMMRRRFEVVLILVAVYTSELRRLLPSDTPLTKQKLIVLLTQGIEEASVVDLPVYRIDAEVLASLLLRLLADES